MDMPAARRLAHGQVAALVRVNLNSGDGDLFVGLEDITADDLVRFDRACGEIIDYHEKREGP